MLSTYQMRLSALNNNRMYYVSLTDLIQNLINESHTIVPVITYKHLSFQISYLASYVTQNSTLTRYPVHDPVLKPRAHCVDIIAQKEPLVKFSSK